ncbi:MAG TPA: hypothetical protein VGI60_02510 [Chthoniobacterales bacterium]|jgi:hypothetical protein
MHLKGTPLKEVKAWPFTFGGEVHKGWLPPEATTPVPTPIESALLDVSILEESGGYLLVWSASPATPHSEFQSPKAGDTWHESIDDAEETAHRFFGILSDDWCDATRKT